MKRLTSFTLEEHIAIGNILKTLRNELVIKYTAIANERGKSNEIARRFKKAINGLDAVKDLMEDVMFYDYPQVGNEYLNTYYGHCLEKLPQDLNKLKKLTESEVAL